MNAENAGLNFFAAVAVMPMLINLTQVSKPYKIGCEMKRKE